MYIEKIIPNEFNELRLKNMRTIDAYFKLSGTGYLEAYKLFEEQGWTGVYTTEDNVPEGAGGGIENIKAWYAYNVEYFKNQNNTDYAIYQQRDPAKFFVICHSEFLVSLPDYPPACYKGMFFHDFEMRDGKILVHWVSFNVPHLLHAMGIPTPVLEREEKYQRLLAR